MKQFEMPCREHMVDGPLASFLCRWMPFFFIVALFFWVLGPHIVLAEKGEPDQYTIPSRLADKSLLLDAAYAGDTVVCVGERGYILVSEDSGKSWTQIEKVPTRVTLTGVCFRNENTGIAVGHDAVILRTTDGGKSWVKVFSDASLEAPLLDVWFKDLGNGFAVGAYGLFLETVDGGMTWTKRYISDDDYHLNHICRSVDGRFYIAAESGRVYISTDAGANWQQLLLPYDGSIFCTMPIQDDTLLAFGLRGNVFRTENAGQSWKRIETHTTAMLNDAEILDDGRIIVVGLAGALLESRDRGESFHRIGNKRGRQGISKIVEVKSTGLLFFGEFGVQKIRLEDLNS